MDWFSRCCAPASNSGMVVKSPDEQQGGGLAPWIFAAALTLPLPGLSAAAPQSHMHTHFPGPPLLSPAQALRPVGCTRHRRRRRCSASLPAPTARPPPAMGARPAGGCQRSAAGYALPKLLRVSNGVACEHGGVRASVFKAPCPALQWSPALLNFLCLSRK